MTEYELIEVIKHIYLKSLELKQLNQESNYRNHRDDIKKRFKDFRDNNRSLSPQSKHANIKRFGGGFCGEHAEFLAYELRLSLNQYPDIFYEIKQIRAKCDHAYIYLGVCFNQNHSAYFRLDLWEKDFQRLTYNDYHNTQFDTKWGLHTISALLTSNTPLSYQSKFPPIMHNKSDPIKVNNNPFTGTLPKNIYADQANNIYLAIDKMRAEQQKILDYDLLSNTLPPLINAYYQEEKATHHQGVYMLDGNGLPQLFYQTGLVPITQTRESSF